MRPIPLAALACAMLNTFFPLKVWAHARFKPDSISMRNTNTGNKTGPCGSGSRNANPTPLQGGQQLTLQWEENVNHPGRYVISFSQDGQSNFQTLATIEDTQNDQVLGTNYHNYSQTVTIPNVTCNNCVIQLIQVMTNTNPASNYYSCADVRVTATTTNPGDPANNPTDPVVVSDPKTISDPSNNKPSVQNCP